MKKIAIFVLISITSIFAQTAGNSGESFLKNGFGARNIAMSDFGVVGISDLTSLNYNPALLANYSVPQLMITHSQSIQDMSTQLVGASFSLYGIPFAVGVNSTAITDIEVRTKDSEIPESTFNAHYMFASLSTGFYVTDYLAVGTTVKYIYENIFVNEADGFAVDLGVSYKNIIHGLDIGASIKNIGSLSKLRSEATKLPTDLRIGFAYSSSIQSIKSIVNVIGGVQKYTDTDDIHVHAGAEVFYKSIIALRLGYMTGYEAKGFTAGVGFFLKGINFDYAFTPYSYILGSTHTVSLTYSFN